MVQEQMDRMVRMDRMEKMEQMEQMESTETMVLVAGISMKMENVILRKKILMETMLVQLPIVRELTELTEKRAIPEMQVLTAVTEFVQEIMHR